MTTAVAGVVVETTPGAAPRVAVRLATTPGVALVGGDGARRLAAVLEADGAAALEALAGGIVRRDDEVVGVFPTVGGVAEDPA